MLKKQQDRNQLQMMALDEIVSQESIVSVIDTFIDLLDLEDIGFEVKGKIRIKRVDRKVKRGFGLKNRSIRLHFS